ncbi:MAG: hypothetical protein AAGF60_13225 [Pseudomonadota bacterium]
MGLVALAIALLLLRPPDGPAIHWVAGVMGLAMLGELALHLALPRARLHPVSLRRNGAFLGCILVLSALLSATTLAPLNRLPDRPLPLSEALLEAAAPADFDASIFALRSAAPSPARAFVTAKAETFGPWDVARVVLASLILVGPACLLMGAAIAAQPGAMLRRMRRKLKAVNGYGPAQRAHMARTLLPQGKWAPLAAFLIVPLVLIQMSLPFEDLRRDDRHRAYVSQTLDRAEDHLASGRWQDAPSNAERRQHSFDRQLAGAYWTHARIEWPGSVRTARYLTYLRRRADQARDAEIAAELLRCRK